MTLIKASRTLARMRVNKKATMQPAGQRKIEMSVAKIVEHFTRIATADPNELVQHRRVCCRYCYGINHQYQWVELVYSMECARAIDANKKPPSAAGGFGYDAKLPPNPYCPICFGEGHSAVYLADTRQLSQSGKLLYAGLKQKKGGVEILMRNQDKALENLAKILGMFKINFTLEDKRESALQKIDAMTYDPIEAAKIYQEQISGGVK